MPASIFVLLCLAGLATNLVELADAKPSPWADSQGAMLEYRAADAENTLSSELLEFTRGGYGEAKLSGVELELLPMFDSLPKNEHGNLAPAAVRYALSRFFVKKHGWFVNGLESEGTVPNVSSPTSILKNRVPSYIERKFEEQLGGPGFDLHHLAALISAFEHLVHDDAMGKLQASYLAHQFSPSDLVTEQEARQIIEVYMISQITGAKLSQVSKLRLEKWKKRFVPNLWPKTQEWIRDVQHSVVYTDRGVNNPFLRGDFSLARVVHIVEQMGDWYGKFKNLECHSVKGALMEIGKGLVGRMELSKFHQAGKSAKHSDFAERHSVENMRGRGQLDESNPQMPTVIIPNYLSSRSNCFAGSSFFSVCCISQCEGLMGHLENSIAMPTSEPQRIATIVAAMPSDTTEAPRNLSSSLLIRLDSIAQRHGGRVPLHGRLFAQWMHHAYPNECPYPHLPAETTMQVAEQVFANPVADKELPWMNVEDLLAELEQFPLEVESGSRSVLRSLAFVGALLSLVVNLARTSSRALRCGDNAVPEKDYV